MTTTTTTRGSTRRAPLYLHIAAWAAPVLLLTGFAMVALVPILVVLIGGLVDRRSQYLRWWGVAVAALYAVPLTIWPLRADPAPSLTKDMHPVLLGLVAAAAVALLVRFYVGRRAS